MSILKLMERMGVPLKELLIWVPDSNTKTLWELLSEPLDAIYITRRQIEREVNNEPRH